MILRLLGGLLLLTACGKQVSINHTALEESSKLESGQTKSYQNGAISKMSNSNSYLVFNNSSYEISNTSSLLSKEFIKGLSKGETRVRFKGEIVGRKVVIKEISKEP